MFSTPMGEYRLKSRDDQFLNMVCPSARFAPVGFLFQRKGSVTVTLERGSDLDTQLEKLIETALEAEAEDFEQSDPSEDVVEVEVGLSS